MSLSFVLSIISLVLAIIYGIMSRASTPAILIAVAVILLATIHVLGGSLVVR
jgi:hypothetical protein